MARSCELRAGRPRGEVAGPCCMGLCSSCPFQEPSTGHPPADHLLLLVAFLCSPVSFVTVTAPARLDVKFPPRWSPTAHAVVDLRHLPQRGKGRRTPVPVLTPTSGTPQVPSPQSALVGGRFWGNVQALFSKAEGRSPGMAVVTRTRLPSVQAANRTGLVCLRQIVIK